MKQLLFIACIIIHVGCSKGSDSSSAAIPVSAPAPSVAPTPIPAPSSTPVPAASPTPLVLTYYTATALVGNPGGQTILTGYCVNYESNTYCWDSGETLITSLGNVYGSYFGMTNGLYNFSTVDEADLMAQPTIISTDLLTDMSGRAEALPSHVLGAGTPIQVNCTLSGTSLNCIDFAIELNQVPL